MISNKDITFSREILEFFCEKDRRNSVHLSLSTVKEGKMASASYPVKKERRCLKTVMSPQSLSITYSAASAYFFLTPTMLSIVREVILLFRCSHKCYREHLQILQQHLIFFFTFADSNGISLLIHLIKCTNNTENTRTNR